MIQVRQITNPLDGAVGKFGKLQRKVYFDADMLIPASIIRMMIGTPMAGRSNFLVVAEEGKTLLGGTFFHLMKESNCGFSSFMGVDPAHRGKGISRMLHQERFRVLDEAAGRQVNGVFIDVVAPERLSGEELEDEHKVGSDPTLRRTIFQKMGFRKLNIRYEQPVGGPNGGPVTNMDLLFCPHEPAEQIPTDWVLKTMRAYWTPWLGAGRAKLEVEKLKQWAGGDWLRLEDAI